MFTKLKQIAEGILAKVGVIKDELEHYLVIGVTILTKLQSIATNPLTEWALKDLFPDNTKQEFIDAVAAAIPKAITYLTQSQDVLNASGDPLQMLKLFLADLQNDTVDMKDAKLKALIGKIIAEVDGNGLLPQVYNWLLHKYVAHAATNN